MTERRRSEVPQAALGFRSEPEDYTRTQPVFERDQSPLTSSNDGRLWIGTNPAGTGGFAVIDSTDDHVEFFTMKREVADAMVAGYDYARHVDERAARELGVEAVGEPVRHVGEEGA